MKHYLNDVKVIINMLISFLLNLFFYLIFKQEYKLIKSNFSELYFS